MVMSALILPKKPIQKHEKRQCLKWLICLEEAFATILARTRTLQKDLAQSELSISLKHLKVVNMVNLL